MEHIKTNDTVRFGVTTHNISGVLTNADITPRWSVFEEATDTPILEGAFTQRTGYVGTYRGTFDATLANGFDANSYYEIQASGSVDNLEGRAVIKTFVLDDVFDANVVQVTGDPVVSTDVNDYHAPPTGIVEAIFTDPRFVYVSGELAPVYYATTKFVKDYKTNSQDEYTMSWYRNNQALDTSSVTNPSMSVFETASTAAIISNQAMTDNDNGVFRYSETTAASITKSGEPYLWLASGIIDGAYRIWKQAIGIDLL